MKMRNYNLSELAKKWDGGIYTDYNINLKSQVIGIRGLPNYKTEVK